MNWKNGSKNYTGTKLNLKNISFTVSEAEIIGFARQNDTGKSTTLKMINWLTNYDIGEIRY